MTSDTNTKQNYPCVAASRIFKNEIETIQEDSLNKRYGYKVTTNLVALFINIIVNSIVPRGLGPGTYGDFSFLSAFFSKIANFLNVETVTAFYVRLCQRQNDGGLVSFYLSFIGLEFVILLVLVAAAHLSGTYTLFCPGQKLTYIYMAAVWALLMLLVNVLSKMADAYGVTVFAEVAKVVQKVVGLTIILLLFFMDRLTLTNFFLYHYGILILLALMLVFGMAQKGCLFRQGWKLTGVQVRGYTREFYDYCHPLFVSALFVLIVGVFDGWMLQKFGGSIQQGFYGLSFRIGAICFLFTSAMTPLITREHSIAFKEGDLDRMRRLFRRYVPMLYAVAGYFACFLAVEAGKIVAIMGGEEFQSAALAVTIMSFYPLHQTYGQLTGSVFRAADMTRLFRNIKIVFLLLGIPATYFLIVPQERMGLNAGAIGLAVKMVGIQLVAVNVQLYFIARLLKIRFWNYVAHQMVSVGCMLATALTARFLIDQVLALPEIVILRFFLAGILYTIMAMALVYFQPVLLGVTRRDINSLVQLGIKKCKTF